MWKLVLAVALAGSLAGCGGGEPSSSASAATSETTTATRTLPDGGTATADEAAFLDDVLPQLSGQRAEDPAGVLNEGHGYCEVYANPASADIQAQAVDVLVRAGWTTTDAQVTIRAASEHLC